MASHHHHHPNNRHSTCSSCCCSSQHPASLSASPSPTDSLLQAIASYLLQCPPPNIHPQYLKHQHQYQQRAQTQQHQQHNQSLLLLQSLVRRVAALESSLHHLPSTSPYPPPPTPSHPLSLRDLAARIIQSHFRAFLVRRSQTLRHLKDLATIKSNLTALKSSLSDKTLLRTYALSQKASDLLFKLDSIQSRDSMIRQGKKAISGELVRFLESIDRFSAKSEGTLPKSKKEVSFAENAGNIDFSGEYEFGGVLMVVENDDVESNVKIEGFHQIADDEKNPRMNLVREDDASNGNFQCQYGNPGLSSSPLLVKAEDVNHGISGILHDQNGNLDFPSIPTVKGAEFNHGMNGAGFRAPPLLVNGEEYHASGNLGLSAPVPVQMENRGSDWMKKLIGIPRNR